MAENLHEGTMTHQHIIKIETRNITKYLVPPILFGLALYGTVKTEGKLREITWSMMGFAAISIWNNLF